MAWNQMPVSQPRFLLVAAFAYESAAAILRFPPAGRLGSILPARWPPQLNQLRRNVIRVIDKLQQRRQLVRRLPRDMQLRLVLPLHIDIPSDDADRFPRQPDQSLDVVDCRVARILEDDHVPPLRLAEVIRKL